VLYAYTPEIFPTKDRGTGNGLAATANRIFGVMAPIIASILPSFLTCEKEIKGSVCGSDDECPDLYQWCFVYCCGMFDVIITL
jgi:hypothetical protein